MSHILEQFERQKSITTELCGKYSIIDHMEFKYVCICEISIGPYVQTFEENNRL